MSPHRTPLYKSIETVMAVVLIVFSIRIALPIGTSAAYTSGLVKAISAVLVAAPGLWLLFARSAKARPQALLTVVFTYFYLTVLSVLVDWTRFGAAAASLGLATVGIILYAGARAERHRE